MRASADIPPRPSDTSADADRVQTSLLRAAGTSRRLGLSWSLSANVIGMARAALHRARPAASRREIDLVFLETHHGATLAGEVRDDLARRARENVQAE